MRVAIYEPEFRVAGPVNYTFHLREGLVALGHECDVVTFTRSGRPSATWGEDGQRDHIRWWHRVPEVTAPFKDAAEVLAHYDRVILSDARITSQNKRAEKGMGAVDPHLPDYVAVLLGQRTPFTYCLHSNTYPDEEVDHLPLLHGSPAFIGRGVTYGKEPDLTRPIFREVTWLRSRLPYRARYGVGDGPSPGQAVGITGRYVPNKGHHALGLAAGTGRITADVELWGACSVGAGPSQTFKTYEALVELVGLKGHRWGPEPDTPNGGNLIRPYAWEVKTEDGHAVRYQGSYTDAVETCRRLAVHVNLTANRYSDGMDYVVLESADAGCVQVAVESSWDPALKGFTMAPFATVPGEKKLLGTDAGARLLDVIGDLCNCALDVVHSPRRRELIEHNREVLASLFDPRSAAAVMMDVLEGP